MKYQYHEIDFDGTVFAGSSSFYRTRLIFKTRRTEYTVGSDSRDETNVIGIASLLEARNLPPYWQLL